MLALRNRLRKSTKICPAPKTLVGQAYLTCTPKLTKTIGDCNTMRKEQLDFLTYARYKIVFLIFNVLLFCTFSVSSGDAQVTSNVLRRTMLIKNQNKCGTAFTIEVDQKQYLITAKHVLSDLADQEDASIEILRSDNKWHYELFKVMKCTDPVDIVVLVPHRQLTVNFPFEPTSRGLAFGQDAYFVGYPTAGTANPLLMGTERLGFIKKATISYCDTDLKTGALRWFIDAINNRGFSGSPLAFVPQDQPSVFRVAGVISAYCKEYGDVKEKVEIMQKQVTPADIAMGNIIQTEGKLFKLKDTSFVVALNSGIAIVWDIKSAVDLIKANPEGAQTKDSFTTQP